MHAQNQEQKSLSIGDLTKTISRSVSNTGSTSSEPSASLSPTGMNGEKLGQHGRQLSETGLNSLRCAWQDGLHKTETAVIDANLKAALKQCKNLSLKEQTQTINHPEYGFIRTRNFVRIISADDDQLYDIRKTLDTLCKPCPAGIRVREIYAMSLAMAKRGDTTLDAKAQAAVYADDLAEYPEDVVIFVCKKIRKQNKWFPTISELLEECEERFEFRRSMWHQLRNRSYQHVTAIEQKLFWRDKPKSDWDAGDWKNYILEAEKMIEVYRKANNQTGMELWIAEATSRRNQAILSKININ